MLALDWNTYVPNSFKTTQVIMINKFDKPVKEVTYRPISLLR